MKNQPSNYQFQSLVRALSTIYDPGEARSIARIVFEDAFHIYDFNSAEEFGPEKEKRLATITQRLLQHEPVQYILGQADFYGLKFKVDARVLIPRQETEELVYWVLETLKTRFESRTFFHSTLAPKDAATRVLDIGTGSGCIPITIKKNFPKAQVHAIDISQDALEVAKENADLNDVEVHFTQFNILDESQWSVQPDYNIIVSNPPYIPHNERAIMAENVLKYEPQLALFVENDDPLIFYRKISEFAKAHLREGGYLFFEVNEFLGEEVLEMMQHAGLKKCELQEDMNGKKRMAMGRSLSL